MHLITSGMIAHILNFKEKTHLVMLLIYLEEKKKNEKENFVISDDLTEKI